MILYFSATGNGKYIAEHIAEKTNEKCMSITECIKEERYEFLNERILGIISPTYFWRLPRIVAEYLKKLEFKNCRYTFFLLSYGTTTGWAGKMARGILKEKHLSFDSYFSVIMPDTWTPVFDLTDEKRVKRWLSFGESELEEVTRRIMDGKTGNFIDRWVPEWIALLPSAIMYHTERKTRNFSVHADACISCGLCERKCPVHAIKMKDGHPSWVEDECEMCLGCLHRCPAFAISYKNGKTGRHGQYKNPNVKI